MLFQPGDQVLELGCGTGEDAIWLAKRGVRVLATDGSPAMLEATARKAQAEGVSELIETRRLDFTRRRTGTCPRGRSTAPTPITARSTASATGTPSARSLRGRSSPAAESAWA